MTPYGCHNSERLPGYYAQAGRYVKDGAFVAQAVLIIDRMSKDCRYDQKATDPRCEGCEK